jgi:hypothetical protein
VWVSQRLGDTHIDGEDGHDHSLNYMMLNELKQKILLFSAEMVYGKHWVDQK